jgi:hypothetical protein
VVKVWWAVEAATMEVVAPLQEVVTHFIQAVEAQAGLEAVNLRTPLLVISAQVMERFELLGDSSQKAIDIFNKSNTI